MEKEDVIHYKNVKKEIDNKQKNEKYKSDNSADKEKEITKEDSPKELEEKLSKLYLKENNQDSFKSNLASPKSNLPSPKYNTPVSSPTKINKQPAATKTYVENKELKFWDLKLQVITDDHITCGNVNIIVSKDSESIEFNFIIPTSKYNVVTDSSKSCIVCIPSIQRADSANLWLDQTSKEIFFFLFVEQAEKDQYLKVAFKNNCPSNYCVCVLPEDWNKRGAPMIREVMLRCMQALYDKVTFKYFFMIDDDIEKFRLYKPTNDNYSIEYIGLLDALLYLSHIANNDTSGGKFFSPTRAGAAVRFSVQSVSYEEKTHVPSSRCEKAVLLKTEIFGSKIQYASHEWFNFSKTRWDEILAVRAKKMEIVLNNLYIAKEKIIQFVCKRVRRLEG